MCTVCNAVPEVKSDFPEALLVALNNSALGLMLSIGHRTGLFDAMEGQHPMTSRELAERASLDERYVREWLGAMSVAGIVVVDDAGMQYRLPDEHATNLTRSAMADNMAVFFQFLSVLGTVEDDVVECFRHGGGVPYEKYTRFHTVMAEESGQTVMSSLFDQILPLVPDIVSRLEEGIDVLDIGCGSGRALNLMAWRFPNSRFVGYDLSEQALETARAEARATGSRNIRFEVRDLSTFAQDAEVEAFDLVTAFDAIHDQGRPDSVLAGIHRTLKRGGWFLMQDIDASSNPAQNANHPLGTFLYTISCMHCMTVSLAQGGMGLGAAWGREMAVRMLEEAGFLNVAISNLEHDIVNCFYTMQKR